MCALSQNQVAVARGQHVSKDVLKGVGIDRTERYCVVVLVVLFVEHLVEIWSMQKSVRPVEAGILDYHEEGDLEQNLDDGREGL